MWEEAIDRELSMCLSMAWVSMHRAHHGRCISYPNQQLTWYFRTCGFVPETRVHTLWSRGWSMPLWSLL